MSDEENTTTVATDNDTANDDVKEQLDTLLGATIAFLVILYIIGYIWMMVSGKGMCKWSAGDNLGIFFLKSIANGFTFGTLGVIMFFTQEDCKPSSN